MLVGYYRTPSEFAYCGRVGTGFTQQSLRELHSLLKRLEQKTSPFSNPPSGIASRGVIHWVKPKVIAEVVFAEWTDDGLLRQASFKGIREDKLPTEITRELPADERALEAHFSIKDDQSEGQTMAPASAAASNGKAHAATIFGGVRLTHPDRLVFPDEKITKSDLAGYYTAVAPYMLPHIEGRPLSLVRCPDGYKKACFYQKHLGDTMPDRVRGIPIKEKAGNATYIAVDDVAGLISLVQMGVLEIHPWGSREDRIDRPDRFILDIDPAVDLTWDDVIEAARHVRECLDSLGLASFVRTTGGKGLHVVVPIARRASWEELKDFAKSFADALVREQPERYIAQSSKAKRTGKLFLDYLRNEKGATAIACYSTRARPGATVATPLSWGELSASLRPGQFNVRTVPERLRTIKHDPWKGFFDIRQAITKAMQTQIEQWTG